MFSRDRDVELRYLKWLIQAAGLLSLLAGVVIYRYAVSTLIDQEKKAIAAESADKGEFLQQADQIRAEHRLLSDRLTQLETNAVMMRQRIPEHPREAEFLDQISEAADEEGLKIHRYERGSLDRKPTHCEFTVRLQCEGDFQAITGFLDRLAALSRVATVQKLSLASSETETYPFDLSLMLYYGAQATEVPGS